MTGELPPALAAATRHQPAARAALAAALGAPAHAYLFAGARGAGKAAAARAFAAELLAFGAPDPGDARRRALAVPSPHPDLTWLVPPGPQHLVDEVRERVVAAAAYRPFEGERRVFVIEAAEAMADESQNALLKTLEEPPPYAHLLLVTSEPAMLLATVRSRCQEIRFAPLSPAAVEERLADRGLGASAAERAAAARLAGGDAALAELLVSEAGRELRGIAERCAAAAAAGKADMAAWRALLGTAEQLAERAAAEARQRIAAAEAAAGEARRARARDEEAVKRAARQARTRALDAGLALVAAWLRDLAAAGEGAPELALNADRTGRLAEAARAVPPAAARRAAEAVMETRRRLRVNVSEELALEALAFSLEAALAAH